LSKWRADARPATRTNHTHDDFEDKTKGAAKMQGGAKRFWRVPDIAFFGAQSVAWNTNCREERVPSDDPNYKELCEQYLASIQALRLHVARYRLHSLWFRQIETASDFESGKIFSRSSAPRDIKPNPPRG